MAKPAISKIKASMLEQLEKKGGTSPFFISLVDDYCNWEKLERDLWTMLNKCPKGSDEWNKFQKNLQIVSNRKLCILSKLDFKTTNVIADDDEEL